MNEQFLLQIVELGISEIVPIEQLIIKLKNYFTLNPNVTISIQNLESEALQANDDTIAMIAKWQADRGLPVTVKPPAPVIQMPSSTSDGSQAAAAPGSAAAGSGPDASAAPAGSGTTQAAEAGSSAVGQTGDHGEIGDAGTNKPKSTKREQ